MYISDIFSPLNEGISQIVYHYTRANSAAKILKDGKFKLSSSPGSVEEPYAPKGYYYFLSTTRSKKGGYHERVSGDAVIFVMDGNYYNSRYPGKSVDYYGDRNPQRGGGFDKPHEAEDRIFSKTEEIPIGGVTEIHLWVQYKPDQTPHVNPRIAADSRNLLIDAKKRGIPVYFYTDESSFKELDKKNLGDVSILKGIDDRKGYVPNPNRFRKEFEPWLELLFKKSQKDLSREADSLRYNISYGRDNARSTAQSLANSFANYRKAGETHPEKKNLTSILAVMKQKGLNTVEDFVNYVADRWRKEKQPATLQEMSEEFSFRVMLSKFFPIVMDHLELNKLPKIDLAKTIQVSSERSTFGGYDPNTKSIQLALSNRHPNDFLRTLAHELVHYSQDLKGELDVKSGDTGSDEENEANSVAGVIMRKFNEKYPEYIDSVAFK